MLSVRRGRQRTTSHRSARRCHHLSKAACYSAISASRVESSAFGWRLVDEESDWRARAGTLRAGSVRFLVVDEVDACLLNSKTKQVCLRRCRRSPSSRTELLRPPTQRLADVLYSACLGVGGRRLCSACVHPVSVSAFQASAPTPNPVRANAVPASCARQRGVQFLSR